MKESKDDNVNENKLVVITIAKMNGRRLKVSTATAGTTILPLSHALLGVDR